MTNAYALSARTVGRSAGVGRRTALAGTVITATVLPTMSKNSIEYPLGVGRAATPECLPPRGLELHAEQSLWRRQIQRLSIVAAKREVDE